MDDEDILDNTQNIDDYCANNLNKDDLAARTYNGLIDTVDKISASADGGHRSQVCARETLRSAPHRH